MLSARCEAYDRNPVGRSLPQPGPASGRALVTGAPGEYDSGVNGHICACPAKEAEIDTYELVLAVAGLATLLAAALPRALERRPGSAPIPLVVIGLVLGSAPIGLPAVDPVAHGEVAERLTELGVIVALMGAGLKIDRPVGWRSWGITWRLLAIGMPLTVVSAAVAGSWALGLPAATAVLFGAALAPTDPVLASDVQVGEPTVEVERGRPDGHPDDGGDGGKGGGDGDGGGEGPEEDDVRFALTSEAGLNDALAFPFTYLAVRLASEGLHPRGWLATWLAVDVVYRLAAGVVVGWLLGLLLAHLFFRVGGAGRLAEASEGFVAVAATLLSYGVAELVHGYGFLAVFVAAVVIRDAERRHEYHQVLHGFAEQIERLLTVGLLLLLGMAVADGVLRPLGWRGFALAVAMVLVLRPVVGWLSMVRSPTDPAERAAIAFFGVRGIGSLYYVAYGATQAPVEAGGPLWAAVVACVLVSVVVHGLTATPVMRRLDRRR